MGVKAVRRLGLCEIIANNILDPSSFDIHGSPDLGSLPYPGQVAICQSSCANRLGVESNICPALWRSDSSIVTRSFHGHDKNSREMCVASTHIFQYPVSQFQNKTIVV